MKLTAIFEPAKQGGQTTEVPCSSSGLRYFKLPADSVNRPFLDLSVTRHAGDFAACGVEPDAENLKVRNNAINL